MNEERIESLIARVGQLEERERELAEVLLGYVRADIAAPWLGAAKHLEQVLLERVK